VADASARLGRSIRLVMVGDGPVRAAWERLARDRRVEADFVGWRHGDDRWPFLRRAHVVAVPSLWPEPFGLVGLEASALGVPAIAFDVGGIREWLRPGRNGVLVRADPPTVDALADALTDLFRRPNDLAAMRETSLGVARDLSVARHLDRLEAILAG
jgi:glycosyltransferase involved in cell wall biosynthesis